MSINLHCKWKGIEVNLDQTPTYITNMCMVQPNGKVCWELTGKKAKHVLQIYCQWLGSNRNGTWKTPEEYIAAHEYIKKRVADIQRVIRSKGKVVTYQQ
jgi:hypothetical protein